MVLYEQRKCFMQGYIMSTSMIVIQILDSFVTGQYYLHHKYKKRILWISLHVCFQHRQEYILSCQRKLAIVVKNSSNIKQIKHSPLALTL
jgi:hypothetical protein